MKIKNSDMDAAFVIAENITRIEYEDLPTEAAEATKKDILDSLGAILAGSTARGIKEIRELLLDWGGKKESTIMVYGDRVPSLNAAFINGTMAHACEYDDIHELAVVHAGASAIPASFAMAERKGKVTGKEFLTSVAIGIDLMCRLGVAVGVHPAKSGWENGVLFGMLGSAVACGRLLRLDADKMLNALGIAYSQCSGNIQCLYDSALTKRAQYGFAAKGAILSAALADKGYTGSRNVFDGKYGMFNTYYDGYNREALLSEFGQRFEVSNLAFKPYPCCRLTHSGIDAALSLATEHEIDPNEIEKVILYHGENSRLCCEPLEVRQKPRSVVDAQFSLPYTVARALLQRKIRLSDFSQESVLNETVSNLAQKVEPRLRQELSLERSSEPTIIEVHLKGNRRYSKRIDIAKGDLQKPMVWDDLAAKFRECSLGSARPLPDANIERIIKIVSRLEEVDDVNEGILSVLTDVR